MVALLAIYLGGYFWLGQRKVAHFPNCDIISIYFHPTKFALPTDRSAGWNIRFAERQLY